VDERDRPDPPDLPDAEGGGADPELVELPLEDVLDLHGFAPRDVAEIVADYLDRAHAAGFEGVRLIHGRGVGVQRERVRSLLARDARVASFGDAPGGAGGWGATIVRFRR
jgi:dsDNA-specific endonuclease/ATPase MutS2